MTQQENVRMTERLGVLAVLTMALAALAPASTLAADHPTNRADNIVGTPGNDVINSKGGRDIMHGRGGNDTLSGGAKGDFLFGNAGDDTLNGDGGNDKLLGGTGADTLNGGDGSDRLFGGRGADTLNGDAGNDIIRSHSDGSVDTIDCGDGEADVAIVDPTDVIVGGCERVVVVNP